MDAHDVRVGRHVPLAGAENVNIVHDAGDPAQSPALTFPSGFAILRPAQARGLGPAGRFRGRRADVANPFDTSGGLASFRDPQVRLRRLYVAAKQNHRLHQADEKEQ